ncbi:ABC transporter ATP-binding protein [Polaromonas hydrogenivorans]|uniref:ABC transporter ATP-binding protein n=1 Tax=Polaromonas hydrogenivorans TaxID=335476 RepID=A0AAU7M0E6_9BURK
MRNLLKVDGVGKNYGVFQALKNVSFSVDQGKTFAIIGPNGAGKTTLFKVMTGEVMGSSGRIFLAGEDITKTPADERVHLGLGRTFQIVRVFPELTLMDNLIVAIEARNRSRRSAGGWLRIKPNSSVLDEAFVRLGYLGLEHKHAAQARHLALGDRKRLELALTLAMDPMILMLDEPTAGMSPSERVAIIELIQKTREELGVTILLTEHDMDFVFRLSHSLMVMNHGETVFVGTPEEVKASELVQQIYLGKEMAHA